MKKHRKYPLTLLEIVVALFLTGILLTTLLVFFKDYSFVNIKMKEMKECVLTRQAFHLRLNQITAAVKSPKSSSSPVYTDTYNHSVQEALFCHFDNGIDVDPNFSHNVLGILYLSKEGSLNLDIQEKQGHIRKEVLFPNVSTFSTQFFDEELQNWSTTWPYSKEKSPLMVKMTIREKNLKKPLVYSFFLPVMSPIIYGEKR